MKLKKSRRERAFMRHEKSFMNGTLSQMNLQQIPFDKQNLYLDRELKKKFKTEALGKMDCRSCCESALYDNGAVTDDELSKLSDTYKKK